MNGSTGAADGDPSSAAELPEVVEVIPGEYDVRTGTGSGACRVVVPAGVGVPGLEDDEAAAVLVLELLARGGELPQLVDLSDELARDPGLLVALEARVDALDAAGAFDVGDG